MKLEVPNASPNGNGFWEVGATIGYLDVSRAVLVFKACFIESLLSIVITDFSHPSFDHSYSKVVFIVMNSYFNINSS